jgi:hypothetical protein
MEPREDQESPKISQQEGKVKKRRFQVVKLEERIAPSNGHTGRHEHCNGGGGGGGGSSTSGTSVSGSIY